MIVALFISLAMSGYALQLRQDAGASSQEKPKNQQEPPPAAKASREQQQEPPSAAKPPRGQTEPKPPKEVKPPKTKEQESAPPSSKQKPAPKQPDTSAQRQPARPSGRSAHIPDAKFKSSFGKPHTFPVKRVIANTNVIVPNQTQFVFEGYTFIFLDPWPEDWLFTDDCYIDYVDEEYFLFDVLHPRVRLALFVVE